MGNPHFLPYRPVLVLQMKYFEAGGSGAHFLHQFRNMFQLHISGVDFGRAEEPEKFHSPFRVAEWKKNWKGSPIVLTMQRKVLWSA